MHATGTQSATFRLPWPPSVNHYWANQVIVPRSGNRPFVNTYLSEAAKKFRVNAQAAIIERFGRIPQPTESLVRVTIVAVQPSHHRRDIDNFLKPTLDALTHARVWVDDRQVRELHVTLGPVEPPGHLEVTVERITDPQGKLFA